MNRVISWKVFATVGGIYGLLYLGEWLLWSERAKERAFKKQYVNFACSKLRQIVDLTSANAGHQVQQYVNLHSSILDTVHQNDEVPMCEFHL